MKTEQSARNRPSPSVTVSTVRNNQIGWHALQHKDGWWVGTENGVTCYKDYDLARCALTILWQREGGNELNYSIEKFTGADAIDGEHTPKLSAVEALQNYERIES
jgi:hypothetical protein